MVINDREIPNSTIVLLAFPVDTTRHFGLPCGTTELFKCTVNAPLLAETLLSR